MATPEEQELQGLAQAVPLERSLQELTEKIVSIKDGLDQEVAGVIARPLSITSDKDCELMTEFIREARDTIDHIKQRHGPVKKFAFQLHRVITGQENALIAPVQKWIDGDGGRLGRGASQFIAAWIQQQKEKREAEQREAQRQLDAQHAKDVEKTAKRLEKEGNAPLADQVRQQGPFHRPVAYVPPVSIPAKTTVKQTFDFEIVNDDEVPRLYCKPDESKIRKQVNLLGKDAVGAIAGVRVFPVDPSAKVRR